MNKSIHKKPLALFSLLALVAAPIMAVAAVIYGEPITINNPTPAGNEGFGWSVSISGDKMVIGGQHDGSAHLYDATTGTLLQTFSTPTGDAGYGWSVSISGDKVLIGERQGNTGAREAGSAYLYDATTGALLQAFHNPTPAVEDIFGWSVSISGDKVLIGAPLDDTGADRAGIAYLFDANTGALLYTFNNPTPAGNDQFGSSVSISDDKIVIGGSSTANSVYLYDATTGTLLRTILSPANNDGFGNSVSISGDKVLIGALGDSTGAPSAGSAYLYDATTGALLQTFHNPTPEYPDRFGHSVSISGDKVLIGTPFDNTGATWTGSAYLFDATTGALLQSFNNPTPEYQDYFGWSVSLSGDKIVIGGHGDNKINGQETGSAYLYLAQTDTDNDGIFDSSDNCPADANADQTDTDGDGQGNLCDFTPNGDTDGDGVDNLADNCPGIANPGQEDNDADGLGNVCDPTPNGDPDPNPTSIDQCKNLGWIDFGFRNQGQCVAFVNTGHDSR